MSDLMFEPLCFFPQCHANCLLPLDDGRILCVYFAGTAEKNPDVGIWLSEWNGKTWIPPRLIVKVSNEAHWNPVLFPVRDGIRLVFKVGPMVKSWRSYTMLSQDGGKTWGDLHGYPQNPAGGPVRSKPIRLANGALLAPNSDEVTDWLPRVDISYDEGETFEFFAPIPVNLTDPDAPNYITGRGAIQPTLWESKPGHVHALLRTSCGQIYRSDSRDSGRTWCQAYSTGFPNNNSGIDVIQDKTGRLFLCCNPVSGDFVARTPISIYFSSDQGKNFQLFTILDDEPLNPFTGATAEFSYPSLAIRGNQLHAAYTHQRRSIAHWQCDLEI